MTKEKIKDLIAKMTLEEKAAMCSGADFWHTESCERLGIRKYGIRRPSRSAQAG